LNMSNIAIVITDESQNGEEFLGFKVVHEEGIDLENPKTLAERVAAKIFAEFQQMSEEF